MGKKYIVYKHTSPNGKSYIGITSQTTSERWGVNGSRYLKENSYFANAIRKYGWDTFSHDILASGKTKKEAIELEMNLILLLRTQNKRYGFNVTAGGDGVNNPSKEVRRRIGEAHSRPTNQYTLDGEYIRTFKSATDAVIEIDGNLKNGTGGIGCAITGRRKTWRNYQWRYDTENNRKKIPPIRTTPHKRAVCQYSMDGKYIRTFESAAEAGRSVGGNGQNITKCLRGKIMSVYGYQWRASTDKPAKDIGSTPGVSYPVKVAQFTLDGDFVEEHISIASASRSVGKERGGANIAKCMNGEIRSAYGFRWMRAEAGANKLMLSGNKFRFEAVI